LFVNFEIHSANIAFLCLHELRTALRISSLLGILVDFDVFDFGSLFSLGFLLVLRDEFIKGARKITTICHHLVERAALSDATIDNEVDVVYSWQEMESVRNEHPCGTGSVVEEHIVEDGLANVGVESREWILDAD
jgi:hypothetical protein